MGIHYYNKCTLYEGFDLEKFKLLLNYYSFKSSVTSHYSGVGEGSVFGPLFFEAKRCDASVVASCSMDRLGRDHAIDVLILLIAHADDVSAVIIGDTEAKIQLAVDVLKNLMLTSALLGWQ